MEKVKNSLILAVLFGIASQQVDTKFALIVCIICACFWVLVAIVELIAYIN